MQALCALILHLMRPIAIDCEQDNPHQSRECQLTPTLTSEHSHLAPTNIISNSNSNSAYHLISKLVELVDRTFGRRLQHLSTMLDCCLPKVSHACAAEDHPVFALVECACDDSGVTLRQFLRDNNTLIATIKRSGDHITPLHLAVIMSASDECVSLDTLLEHSLTQPTDRGFDVETRATTPLHTDTITRAPNAQDPLLSSSPSSSTKVTRTSPSARPSTSSTSHHHHHHPLSHRSQAHNRADLFTAQDAQGNTVLFTAALGGHTNALRRLLSDPCCDQPCLHTLNNNHQDPFFAACWRGRLACAKVLRKAGVVYNNNNNNNNNNDDDDDHNNNDNNNNNNNNDHNNNNNNNNNSNNAHSATDVNGKTARAIALEWGHHTMVEWLDGGAVVD